MVLDAVRQITQQMMVHMRAYFKLLQHFEYESDHILTREQLEQDFQSEYPRYSLLFDTGIGYFAFCIKVR